MQQRCRLYDPTRMPTSRDIGAIRIERFKIYAVEVQLCYKLNTIRGKLLLNSCRDVVDSHNMLTLHKLILHARKIDSIEV